MNDLINIIFLVTLGSIVSLIGGIILVIKEQFALKFAHFLSAYAAGALLGAAFFDLLPEAFEESLHSDLFFWVVVGIVSFFLLLYLRESQNHRSLEVFHELQRQW